LAATTTHGRTTQLAPTARNSTSSSAARSNRSVLTTSTRRSNCNSGTNAATAPLVEGDNDNNLEQPVCLSCGGTPCDWVKYSEDVMKEVNEKFPVGEDGVRINPDSLEAADNKKIRFALYRAFTYQCFGYLGKGNRIKLGSCVENKIKDLFPSE
jgi:hypothetical protein